MASVERELFGDRPVVFVRDVTLSASDDPVTRREKLARVILDELYEFVGLLDAEGRILEINRAALEGAGIGLDDIAGLPFWDARWWAVSGESREDARQMVLRASEGEFVRRDVEVYGRASGSETIIVDYSLTPIRDSDGRIAFLLPEGRNITDKKRAEAELARRTEELQRLLDRVRQLDDAKSNFFANVSHELRTPLSLILGPTEQLLEGAELPVSLRRNVEVVRRNALMLLKQVDALLDLAKIDAGEMAPTYVRLDLGVLVRTAAAHFDALAAQRGITYLVDVPDRLVAEVDADKYERILVNLLSNAFKYTPDHGWIRCRLERSASDRVLLTVQDSGPGVAPALRAEIFDRFQQGRASGSRSGGTGLGLAIVKQFCDLHGGTVTLTDAPFGGAMFQVELPREAPAASYVRDASGAPSAAGRHHGELVVAGTSASLERFEAPGSAATVMVVEDHADMRRFIVEALRGEWQVLASGSADTALAAMRAEPPDLLVTDLMLPGVSGEQLVREIRADQRLAQLPVLVLSARADDALRVELLTGGVQDYVTKPFAAQELRARVRNLVTTKRARDALQLELDTQTSDLSVLTDQLIASRRALQASLVERIEAQTALANAQNDLARMTRATALGALATSIAHEVNQPLAAISANSHACLRWLTGEHRDESEAIAAAERIVREAERASDVIGGIRRFLGRAQGRRELVCVDDVVRDVVAMVRPFAEANQVTIEERSCAPTVVVADRVQIEQVIVNLVTNGIEAMVGRCRGARSIRIETSQHGEEAQLRVIDHGGGFEEGALSAAFDPFCTTKPDGMGMGLAISRSIAEAHGGTLEIERSCATGTTMVLTLPAAAAAPT